MRPEKEIVKELAERKCKAIVNAVRRDFQAMRDCLQSGDDSGLETIWDEICVQAQDEEFIIWEEAYLPTIRQFIRGYVEELDDYAKSAIWYQTDNGWNYAYDPDDREEQERILRYCWPEDDIVDYILGKVLETAESWSNPRIRAYLAVPRSEMDTGGPYDRLGCHQRSEDQ